MESWDLPGGRVEIIRLTADIVVVGGGAAGCLAAVTAREAAPTTDVLVVEKAHVKRSGCLAAGVNAINAYLNPGETPATFLEYVKRDSAGLVRDDLVLSIGRRLNKMTEMLEQWGLPMVRDDKGRYRARGRRSIEISGEHIKPIIAAALYRSGAKVLNRTVAANFIINNGRVAGVFAFSARERKFYIISAKAVICATGGAAGIYRPNNGGMARHKMWYCPSNVGTGLAMGLRAGAEMTGLEMRFIALRIKDALSPTGTVAQGVKARQVNAFGEEYLDRYAGRSTPMRMYATIAEDRAGRGPCYLDLTHIPGSSARLLKEAYLNMSPGMVLKWADEEMEPNEKPVEICGSEPYIVGGHGQAGYWVDTLRQSTVTGLFAAGDTAGGAPKKYVTGCMAEGEIAAMTALGYICGIQEAPVPGDDQIAAEIARVFAPFENQDGYPADEYEERLQKIMDEYAGGISVGYDLSEPRLLKAREFLETLDRDLCGNISAGDMHQLVRAHEVLDRVLVARALVEHLLYRRETRWRAYQERVDYPERDDEKWFLFVNSIYDRKKDAFRILERPVAIYGKTEKGDPPAVAKRAGAGDRE